MKKLWNQMKLLRIHRNCLICFIKIVKSSGRISLIPKRLWDPLKKTLRSEEASQDTSNVSKASWFQTLFHKNREEFQENLSGPKKAVGSMHNLWNQKKRFRKSQNCSTLLGSSLCFIKTVKISGRISPVPKRLWDPCISY